MKTVLLFILLSTSLFGQDSIYTSKNIIGVKAILYPITHGITFGYGGIGMLEYYFDDFNSLAIGFKSQTFQDFGGAQHFSSDLILLEYKKFIKQEMYISPYIKVRKMNYWERDKGNTGGIYDESSIGLGAVLGVKEFMDNKKNFETTVFVGGGYFIPISSEGYYTSWSRRTSGFKPSILFRSIDLRLGLLFGFNFKKKTN